ELPTEISQLLQRGNDALVKFNVLGVGKKMPIPDDRPVPVQNHGLVGSHRPFIHLTIAFDKIPSSSLSPEVHSNSVSMTVTVMPSGMRSASFSVVANSADSLRAGAVKSLRSALKYGS